MPYRYFHMHLCQAVEAHTEGLWCAAWVPGSEGKLLTGSLDESVKSWEVTQDSLAFKHCYQASGDVVYISVSERSMERSPSSLLFEHARETRLNKI